MEKWKWVVLLVFAFLLVMFAVQNYEVAKVKFLFWTFEASRALVIFLSFVIGLILGAILGYRNRKN